MYNIVFYENERGESDVYNFIMALKAAADISKDARINYNKVIASLCKEYKEDTAGRDRTGEA